MGIYLLLDMYINKYVAISYQYFDHSLPTIPPYRLKWLDGLPN